jgi:hypothetical protein
MANLDFPVIVITIAGGVVTAVGSAYATVAWATITGLPSLDVAQLTLLPLWLAGQVVTTLLLSPRPSATPRRPAVGVPKPPARAVPHTQPTASAAAKPPRPLRPGANHTCGHQARAGVHS